MYILVCTFIGREIGKVKKLFRTVLLGLGNSSSFCKFVQPILQQKFSSEE